MEKEAGERTPASHAAARQTISPATVVRHKKGAEAAHLAEQQAALQQTLQQFTTQLEQAELTAKPEIYTMAHDELLAHLQHSDQGL
ncbi:hypothetical protein EII31_02985 [Leucobacter sp. OH2974_COT-288]|nr:hypothetical protein EII31_02985 [Leucobacter sp. OH2974_COT-288]